MKSAEIISVVEDKTQINELDLQHLDAVRDIGKRMVDVNRIYAHAQKTGDRSILVAAKAKLAQLAKQKHDLEQSRVTEDDVVVDNTSMNEGIDQVSMDVELFIRCLEWAKESAQDDIALHKFTENVVAKDGVLTMADYESLIPDGEMTESNDDDNRDERRDARVPADEPEYKWDGVSRPATATHNGRLAKKEKPFRDAAATGNRRDFANEDTNKTFDDGYSAGYSGYHGRPSKNPNQFGTKEHSNWEHNYETGRRDAEYERHGMNENASCGASSAGGMAGGAIPNLFSKPVKRSKKVKEDSAMTPAAGQSAQDSPLTHVKRPNFGSKEAELKEMLARELESFINEAKKSDPIHGKEPKKGTLAHERWSDKVKQDKTGKDFDIDDNMVGNAKIRKVKEAGPNRVRSAPGADPQTVANLQKAYGNKFVNTDAANAAKKAKHATSSNGRMEEARTEQIDETDAFQAIVHSGMGVGSPDHFTSFKRWFKTIDGVEVAAVKCAVYTGIDPGEDLGYAEGGITMEEIINYWVYRDPKNPKQLKVRMG